MINKKTLDMLRSYFKGQPINKVWIFGSYARGEENDKSDVDLLVSFDKDAKVTLFTMGGIYMDLKQLLGKEVDLIEDGTLENYAEESAEKDKKLIYERTN